MTRSTLPKSGPPLTEYLRRETCPSCGRLVLRALDAPRAALDIRVDPYPLDLYWETAARVDGRMTYDVVTVWGRRAIQARDTVDRVTAPRRYPVVAAHRCGAYVPLGLELLEPQASVFPAAQVGETPPF